MNFLLETETEIEIEKKLADLPIVIDRNRKIFREFTNRNRKRNQNRHLANCTNRNRNYKKIDICK